MKACTYYTTSQLRVFGFTPSLIAKHLGSHDGTKPNPVYRTGAPQKTYNLERVLLVLSALDLSKQKAKYEARKAAKKAAEESAIRKCEIEIDAIEINVKRISYESVIRRGMQSRNNRNPDLEPATLGSPRGLLIRAARNYIKHQLTSYSDKPLYDVDREANIHPMEWACLCDRLENRVWAAIDTVYPDLEREIAAITATNNESLSV